MRHLGLSNLCRIFKQTEILLEEKVVPEIEVKLKENNELAPLSWVVRVPPIHHFELRVIPVTDIMQNIDPSSLLKENEEEKVDISNPVAAIIKREPFKLIPHELILDMKTVNLTCDKGTKADYLWVSTTIPKPCGGEDEGYTARIIVFEILHELEKITEIYEKRWAAVIDCCRGYLLSNTEGPEMSTNSAGFKIQLYKLSKSKKRLLDPNPTEPTKILASKVSVMDDFVLFADIQKSFSVMLAKNQQNSLQPVLTRAFECYENVTASAAELWKIDQSASSENIQCVAVVCTEDNKVQIYSSLYETMKLTGDISVGRKITGLKKIGKENRSSSVLYVTQQGSLGVIVSISRTQEIVAEMGLELLSMKLPWQSGLSPLHGCYYAKNSNNNGWRNVVQKNKRNISYYNDLALFLELPIFLQNKLSNEMGLSIGDFRNIFEMI
jgi:hypothetical protein